MSKSRKPNAPKSGEKVPVLYLRIDARLEAAIQKFIRKQPVPPDRTAVGLTALQEFLHKHGCLDPEER